MRFGINDLKEFEITESEVVCTTSFVKPIHIVLASNCELYGSKTFRFKYQKPLDYAYNMKYHEPLDIDTLDGRNHSKAIKLRDTFVDDNQVEKVINILRTNGYLDNDTISTFEVILAEIFQNFYAHAEFDKPPICCVQDWPSCDYLEISIADKGIGMANSLAEVLEGYPEGTNPCQIACDNGVSSKLNQAGVLGTYHSGYGLYYTKRFIEENEGGLYLFSNDKCFEVTPGHESNYTLPYRWQGTAIRLIINKKKVINCESFYQQITREQEGEDTDDFF